jgi:hypothetical protein
MKQQIHDMLAQARTDPDIAMLVCTILGGMVVAFTVFGYFALTFPAATAAAAT